MTIPENIGVNHIQASIFSFLYKTFPHLHQLIHPISVFTQITRNATQITKEPERNATHVLQGCFWDSELSRTWVVFSGHWWEWPCCRRWQWCTGSARNPKTRPPPSTNLRAWKPSEFPFERILCGGKFEMTALMVERKSEREKKLWAFWSIALQVCRSWQQPLGSCLKLYFLLPSTNYIYKQTLWSIVRI